ncbi:hypothetical protein ES703_121595 [subsurface metagenome]
MLILFEISLLLGLIWSGQSQATRESIELFTSGPLRFYFWIGVLGLGLVVPLVVLGIVSIGVNIASLLLIEGVFHLLGVYLLRYIIFKSGVYVSAV